VTIEARFLHTAHQFRGTHTVRRCEPIYRPECWALYTALDGAQLRSIYAKLDVDVELGKPGRISYLTQHTSESLFRT
jgi:hypothetical protein